MNRISSFVENSTVVSSLITPSAYDKVVVVYDNMVHVTNVSNGITEVVVCSGNIEAIKTASQLIDTLSATAETVLSNVSASAELVGSNIHIKVPAGQDGDNGMTPLYTFTYNEATGDIDYEITGYEAISGNTTIEEI